MSLMGTLAKVAIGYAAARGVDKVAGGGGLGALLGGGAAGDQAGAEGAAQNPLQAMMAQMTGGGAAAGGGMPDMQAMLGGLMGGGAGRDMLDGFGKTAASPPEAEASAGLMLRAMIQAAKCDGDIDDAERAKILETVGEDADAEDIAFVQAQLAASVDVEALAADTPDAMKMQVYAMSMMSIRVDTPAEKAYMSALAEALGIDAGTAQMLNMQMGATS